LLARFIASRWILKNNAMKTQKRMCECAYFSMVKKRKDAENGFDE